MFRTVVLLSALVLWVYALNPKDVPKEIRELTGEKLVEHINKQGKWQAATNPKFEGMTKEELKRFTGALKKPSHMRGRKGTPAKTTQKLDTPASFDAVQAWPQCSSIIGLIQDQSACGSCWAVSTTSSMNDRLCISSNAKIQTTLSSLDVMACCSDCGYQCQGGWPDEAFYYWTTTGVVTGTNYTVDGLCKPYPIAPCTQDPKTKKLTCPDEPTDDYKCQKKCQSSYTAEPYKNDHYYGQGVNYFFPKRRGYR